MKRVNNMIYNYKKILDLKITSGDCDGQTIKEALFDLLETLITEEESFSGKRPFGNSGWMYDFYITLIKEDKKLGSLDEDGFIKECDNKTCKEIIINCN